MTLGICPFAEQLSGVTGQNPGYVDRVGFCDHTAGGFMSTMKRASFWNDPNGDGNPQDRVSAHFAISMSGEILQIVNIFDTAWAQGRLGPRVNWPLWSTMGQRNPNGYLISTEHEDKTITNLVWPDKMIEADIKVKKWCIQECASQNLDILRFDIESMTGHHMFDDVNRAYCPGNWWKTDGREMIYNAIKEDDLITRFNGIAFNWDNKIITGLTELNVRQEMSVPVRAKAVRLELYMSQRAVQGKDGGTQAVAGQSGWGGVDADYGYVDVLLDSEGRCFIDLPPAGQPAIIARLGCLGYWT